MVAGGEQAGRVAGDGLDLGEGFRATHAGRPQQMKARRLVEAETGHALGP